MNIRPDDCSIVRRLVSVRPVLYPVLDIVRESVEAAEPPAWCVARGWEASLLGLDDGVLEACERGDWSALHAAHTIPDDLRKLVLDVEQATCLPRLAGVPRPLPDAALRGVSMRKRQQLSHLLGVTSTMAARARRIIDIGSGSGHLSRLAAELFGRETLALEREPQRVAEGNLRAQSRARAVGELGVRFSVSDVLVETPELRADDLAIGLHACGELGDEMVRLSGAARCDLVLLSCCLQKIRGSDRAPISRAGEGLALPRGALGLTNLTAQAQGVEASLGEALRAREARYGLRLLLRARGLKIAAGEEMRGVNRRRAQNGLAELAQLVLARRSLAGATTGEIRHFERTAATDYAAIRRLSIPRHLLSRLVELSVVLDRGAALEEHGQAVRVATLFDTRVSPRNLALFASADRGRLPSVHA